MPWFGGDAIRRTHKDAIDSRRSWVRVVVTYMAALFAFGGGALLIALALFVDSVDDKKFALAKDMFALILPIATGVITYWFATRKSQEADASDDASGQRGVQQNRDDKET